MSWSPCVECPSIFRFLPQLSERHTDYDEAYDDVCMYGCMDVWMYVCMDEKMDGWMMMDERSPIAGARD